MVNTAFAWQFTWGCKFESPCFNLSVHFSAPNLQRVNLVQIKFFVRCLLRAARRACRFCLVGQALYAARAPLFSSLASVISSVWESSSLVGLPTENGEGSIVEVFPSITCVTIVRTWKRFLKRTCKFLDFTLFTGFAHVKARPPLLFCVIQLL